MAKTSYLEFKTQLYNGILSCPIVYINHYHYFLVDEVLENILSSSKSLNEDNVLEYDRGLGCVVSFREKEVASKYAKYTSVKSILRELVCPKLAKRYSCEEESLLLQKRIYLFKGLNRELIGEEEVSLMQTFATQYEAGRYNNNTTIIIVSPHSVTELPIALRKYVTILEIKPPSVEEIKQYILRLVGEEVFKDYQKKKYAEEMIRTLQGLQMYEVKQTLKTALLCTNNKIYSSTIRAALEEKERIVKKTGIIEVVEPNVKFEDIGGLQNLHDDLKRKSKIYENLGEAVKYNIPIPKGILIIGMPGCGKSMIAKATANLFKVSLLRLDVNRLMGKYVGESEANLRLALETAEAAHPCVLWIDEIEKAFAGTNNGEGGDSMVVMRMMGHFLTWMQERKTPVYIVATANGVMRPEFMRKGRFDEVYFVDFPNSKERAEILRKQIEKKYPKENEECLFDFSELGDCTSVVKKMKKFAGSEIECVLNTVVEKKFSQYLNEKNEESDKSSCKSPKVIIRNSDFDDVITHMEKHIMANQKGKNGNKTPIELIKEMQEMYKFEPASEWEPKKKSKKNDEICKS